jgi:hypothetical protein
MIAGAVAEVQEQCSVAAIAPHSPKAIPRKRGVALWQRGANPALRDRRSQGRAGGVEVC